MTRSDMIEAIEAIEQTPKHHVYASRKGIVGAVEVTGGYIAFRRVDGDVQAETCGPATNQRKVDDYSVPPDLRERVKAMLDNL